jgi:hypothetical protein
VYIKGSKEASRHGFEPFLVFPELEAVYQSDELFSFFANRLLQASRGDYSQFVKNLGLDPDTALPIEILARSGGRRVTDAVELFGGPVIDQERNVLDYLFLVHGLRHMRDCAQDIAGGLEAGESLFLFHDMQNPVDTNAIALRTSSYCCVGFLPNYMLDDCWDLIRQHENIEVNVERVNLSPAPIQQRIVCRMQATKKNGFTPLSSDIYEPLIGKLPSH